MQVFRDTLKGVGHGWRTPYGEAFNRSRVGLGKKRSFLVLTFVHLIRRGDFGRLLGGTYTATVCDYFLSNPGKLRLSRRSKCNDNR